MADAARTDTAGPAAARSVRRRLFRGLRVFSHPGYGRLWTAGVVLALATWGERVAISWLVLTETDSILMTAAVMAAGSAPGILAAPVAGTVADRVRRPRMLLITALAQAALVSAIGLIAIGGIASAWPVLALVALRGVASSFGQPAMQALITDTAGRQDSMTAISVASTGARAVGVLGALASGIVSDRLGVAPALFGASGAFVVAGVLMSRVPAKARTPVARRPALLGEAVRSVRVLAGIPPVATLLVMAMVVEIFGFAYGAVLPAVARDVLHVSATGFGTLTFMAGVGAVVGVAGLSLFGDYPRKSMLVIGITLVFGAAMIGFAVSSSLTLSLVLVACVGGMAGAFDAMQWTLLQAHVPDEMRGRAVAGWVFAVGFGWIGHLLLGTIAEQVGVQWALGASGGMLLVTGAVAAVAFRRVRIG